MARHRVLKRKHLLAVGLVLLAALVFAAPAMATEIISDQDVVIGANEVIDDDLVFAGNTLVVDGVIRGDVVAVGSAITINGTVEGDVLAAAQTVTINGEVMDDLRGGGYLVKLGQGAVVGDSVLLAAYSVEAYGGSRIGGDAILGAAQALLATEIDGDLLAGANGVLIEGSILGDATLSVGEPAPQMFVSPSTYNPQLPPVARVSGGLTFADGASVGGDLNYSGPHEGHVPAGVVSGRTNFTLETPAQPRAERGFRVTQPGRSLERAAGSTVLRLLRTFITLALVGLLIVWLAPQPLTTTVDTFRARPWDSLGVGFLGYVVGIAALVILPIVLILLGILLGIISLGGLTSATIALGALGWSGLLVAFVTATSWLAKIVLGLWLGQLIWKAIKPEGTSLVPPLLIGVVIATLLMAIPVVRGLLGFAVALFGLGAIILTAYARLRPAAQPAPADAA